MSSSSSSIKRNFEVTIDKTTYTHIANVLK